MKCPNCYSVFDSEIEKCTKCGFPFAGTDHERSVFIGQQVMKVQSIDDARSSLLHARTVLFVLGGLSIISALSAATTFEQVFLGVVGAVFVAFGFMVQKNPIVFLTIALGLLLLFYLADAIAEPITLVKGLVWKVIFVGSLVYAIIRVRRAEKLKSESDYLSNQ
jgi:hypothetical protein